MGTIQSAINQTLGGVAIGAGIAKKAKDMKEKINEKQIKKESKTDTPKLTPEEKWLNSLEPDQRKIIDSLSPKARQYVLEQAGIEPMRRDLANARAKSAIQNKKAQRDGYTQFMRAGAGKEE